MGPGMVARCSNTGRRDNLERLGSRLRLLGLAVGGNEIEFGGFSDKVVSELEISQAAVAEWTPKVRPSADRGQVPM